MRVALDGLLLGGRHSGVERAIEALAEALPTAAPQHSYLLACRRQYARERQLPLPLLRAPAWVRARALRIAYEQLLLAPALRGRCDLLHGLGYVLPGNWRGPSVLSVYDLIALDFPAYCKRTNAWHYRWVLPRSIRQASRVVVPSQAVANRVSGRFPEAADRVRVIPLGISEHYAPAPEAAVAELRQRLGLPERFLLYVGNLEPKKNLPGLIAAFDLVADKLPHALLLAGRPAWGHEAIEGAAAQARHANRIQRLGYVAEADLPALYTAADALVQWSHYEGMGLPPLEAMACGTPAIVSDGGALPETAGPAALVVPLGPPARLAAALCELLDDRPRLKAMSRLGREHAARFTWSNHARQVAALYEEIAHAGD
jgi:glycosyltransferase involved in cell wall biosynthesis